MLNKEYLVSEYNHYKKKAFEVYDSGDVKRCLDYIEYCGNIAWRYPILFNYIDDKLEDLLAKIANDVLEEKGRNQLEEKKTERRAVLYAGQIVDSGALTEQYLNFFIENEFDILVIIPDIKNTIQGKSTLKLLQTNPKIKLFIPKTKSKILKIKEIYNQIINFNPSTAFLHFVPNDIVGYCVFSQITIVPKYYIVHNDHTFWFGKGCSDYFVEFRKFGYLLSVQRRKIPHEKIIMLPYYPINNGIPFSGFSFETRDKVIGISGALSMYKYLLDPELKYFHAIKELLRRNPDFIFCLCGSGADDKIFDIFSGSDITNRFHYMGKRDDFYSLVGHCDILFESYPLKGGLTVLFAIEQKKAVVGIGNNRNASGCLQDWFDLEVYKEPLTIEEFIDQADKLIKDSKYREENILKFSNSKFNKTDFDKGLQSIIRGEVSINLKYSNQSLMLDDEYFLNEYISIPDGEVSFLKNKLYILKTNLSRRERLKIFYRLCKLLPLRKILHENRTLASILIKR